MLFIPPPPPALRVVVGGASAQAFALPRCPALLPLAKGSPPPRSVSLTPPPPPRGPSALRLRGGKSPEPPPAPRPELGVLPPGRSGNHSPAAAGAARAALQASLRAGPPQNKPLTPSPSPGSARPAPAAEAGGFRTASADPLAPLRATARVGARWGAAWLV